MRLCVSIIILLTLSCGGKGQRPSAKWESSNKGLSFKYADPWSILPTLDTKEKMLTGVIDYKDGKSYIIQITPDITKTELSEEAFFESVKKTMLGANSKNRLIRETDTLFHGMNAHKQVYLLHTDKWGLMQQTNFVIRTGIEFASVQISFPIADENVLESKIPAQIAEFDKTVIMSLK